MHGVMLCTGWQEDVARILRSLRSGRREMERLCKVDDSDENTSEEDEEEVGAPWPSPHCPCADPALTVHILFALRG